MELGLDDEQDALVASFAALLARSSSFDRVRAAEPSGLDPDLWEALTAIGAVTMSVPEAQGGWGASLLDLSLVAEQLGRAAAPAPVIEAQVAARVLARCPSAAGTPALRSVLAGERMITIGLRPARSSVCELVPAGAMCDAVVALDGDHLRLVPVEDAGRRPVLNLASAPLADLSVGGGEVLAGGDAAAAILETALDEWLVLTSAAIGGLATVALEQACAYAVERRAFGRPIGAFQGVSHPLADGATALDGARLLVRKAAWSLDRGNDRGRELAAMAFAFTVRAAEAVTYDAVHVHGGYGFMIEHDVQLLYRRVRGWSRVWGDSRTATRRVAAARYGRP